MLSRTACFYLLGAFHTFANPLDGRYGFSAVKLRDKSTHFCDLPAIATCGGYVLYYTTGSVKEKKKMAIFGQNCSNLEHALRGGRRHLSGRCDP